MSYCGMIFQNEIRIIHNYPLLMLEVSSMERRIVLITDSAKDLSSADLGNIHMEGNSISASLMIRDAIASFAPISFYTELEDFRDHIKEHEHDLVFPMRYGPTSRTQKGLISSLCETYGIDYMGADNYTQLLCNDKDLSKKYAREFGFNVPSSIMFRALTSKEEMLDRVRRLNLPLVVKPNFGGGSAGISDNSLVHDYTDAVDLVRFHMSIHTTPVLVEEYIAGQEVSILMIGSRENMAFCGETQLVINDQTYFDNRIWGYEEKKIDDSKVDFKVSHLTTRQEREQAVHIFQSFEKVEYMRVDGRVTDRGFYLLELSPDCYLGPESDFEIAMKEQLGLDYPGSLKFIIENSLNRG